MSTSRSGRSGIFLHPRQAIVAHASLELSEFTVALAEKYDLTYIELAKIMVERTADYPLRYALRRERHPRNPNKKADEA